MSIESFVQAMPKVELFLHLEGAMQKDRLVIIAEQNEIPDEMKRFNEWVALLEQPECSQLQEIVDTTIQWLRHPDDLTHVTYELGVSLAKQNTRYAEVSVNPINFTEHGWTIEQFLAALNDGRDRVQRGWGVQMRWVLSIARDQPRHADEIVRWANSTTGQTAGIVGIVLAEPAGAQPIGQFERAFRTASKKQVSRFVFVGQNRSDEKLSDVLEQLEPTRLIDAWHITAVPEALQVIAESNLPLTISLSRAQCYGWVETLADYPLRALYDSGIPLILGSDMPSLYRSSLNDEYAAAVQQGGLTIEELEQVAINAIHASQMLSEEKTEFAEAFQQQYAQLRDEHLGEEEIQ